MFKEAAGWGEWGVKRTRNLSTYLGLPILRKKIPIQTLLLAKLNPLQTFSLKKEKEKEKKKERKEEKKKADGKIS